MRQEKKVNSRKKRIRRLLCLFFLLAFMITGYFVYRYYQNDKKQEDRFDQLEEIEEERDKKPVPSILPTEITNPDWIGWLKIKGEPVFLIRSCNGKATASITCTVTLTGNTVFTVHRFWIPDALLTVTTVLFTDTISTVAGCSGRFMRIPMRVIIKNIRKSVSGQGMRNGSTRSCP